MELDEYEKLSRLQFELWWFRGMQEISIAMLESRGTVVKSSAQNVLDAGCGTGGMLRALESYGRTVGLDSATPALTLARKSAHSPLVRASIAALPFKAETFDIVTSFDVLYHRNVFDDVAALRELARVLKKKGTLLIRVPAYDGLRSRHDEAVHTRQRYGKGELISKLRSAGLEPVFVSFANSILFPLALIRRLSERWRPAAERGSEVEPVAPWLNKVLASVLKLEAVMLRHVSLPFGLSLVALARRRETGKDIAR